MPKTTTDLTGQGFFGEFDVPSLVAKNIRGRNSHRGGSSRQSRSGRPAGNMSGAGGFAGPVGRIHNGLLTHQAMVKIVPKGMVKNSSHLAGQLKYISRDGALELDAATGALAQDANVDIADVVKDWKADWQNMRRQPGFYTYHMIVSYPADTDHEAAKAAAKDFSERLTSGEYGDVYKHVIAHHTDTKNPHAHIIINRAGENGKTLHISRYGIDVQTLRELHVETARGVGITLNATSRFSRGVDRAPKALGRIHAERAGRALPLREKPPIEAKIVPFPHYGAAHRPHGPLDAIETAKAKNIAGYRDQAESFHEIEKTGLAKRHGPLISTYKNALMEAAQSLSSNLSLIRRENTMADEKSEPAKTVDAASVQASVARAPAESKASEAAQVDAVFKDINNDFAELYQRAQTAIAKEGNEERQMQMEAEIGRYKRKLEPVLSEDTYQQLGLRKEKPVEPEERAADPGAQRRDASDAVKTGTVDPRLERDAKPAELENQRHGETSARLEAADAAVQKKFEAKGLSGNLAISRIVNAPDVDRATRDKWMERDVQSYANANSLSAKQALSEVQNLYKEAAGIYRDARIEINEINKDYAAGRRDLARNEALSQNDDARQQSKPELVSVKTPARQTEDSRKAGSGFKPMKGVEGKIVEYGESHYQGDKTKNVSPYIVVEKTDKSQHQIWGVDLKNMMTQHGLKVGDKANIHSPGSTFVNVTERDKDGKTITKEVERRAWEASNIEKAPREKADRSISNEKNRDDRGR